MSGHILTADAGSDLEEIWEYIADGSIASAITSLCTGLSEVEWRLSP